MSTITKPCPYKHHQIFPSKCGAFAIVALDDEKGEGGFDLYKVNDIEAVEEVPDLSGVYPTPYWIDRVSLEVIQSVYEFLDQTALKPLENVIKLNDYNPNEDIPF